jgi:hypothetical protein
VIERIRNAPRALVVAIGVIAIVAIVGAGLLVVVKPGGTAQSTATPSASTTQSVAPESEPPFPTSSIEPTDSPGPTETPGPETYADLDGVEAPSNLAHRLPVAIMIDDNIVARPQSGFSTASIVYQAPADGGEDRYMMIFQEGNASDIGPVRSARPYFVYWAAEYKAMYGHFGGDVVTLQQTIPAMVKSIYNMDALSLGSCPYHRITTRGSPHNAYTNTSEMYRCGKKRGYPSEYQKLPARPFKADMAADQRPASQSIAVPYRTGDIAYTYEPATNSYLRSVDGKLQTDPANGQQVKARNIIVMFQAVTTDSTTEPGHNRPVVHNVGSGKAIVFHEGKAIVGTWKKTSNTALTRFYDAGGKEIPLVRGQIYIQSVPPATAVTYK